MRSVLPSPAFSGRGAGGEGMYLVANPMNQYRKYIKDKRFLSLKANSPKPQVLRGSKVLIHEALET